MDITKAITHLGLCAGYGGIELGIKRVIPALRTVALCEIEAFAVANLVSKMEAGLMDAAPIWTDLKTFPWEEFRDRVDILTGGYPCQPSVQPASDLEGKTPGISGRTSQEAFQFFNQESASLRTSKDISAWGCPTSSKTWQEWVTERRGAYSARLNAVRHTNASECSSWASITANDWKGSTPNSITRKDGKSRIDQLAYQTEQHGLFYPTPCAMEAEKAGLFDKGQMGQSLSAMANRGELGHPAPVNLSTNGSRPGWLTPQAQDSKHSGTNPTENGERDLLVNQVNWATPRDCEWKGGNMTTQAAIDREVAHNNLVGQVVARPNAGKLNSRWVETLMGLPVGWTMPSCQSPVTIALTNSDSSVTELSQQPPL